MINRREFLGKIGRLTGAGLIGSLGFSGYVFGSSPDISFEEYKKVLEQTPADSLLIMMIYGETSGCSTKEKLFAGITPFNRVKVNRSYYGGNSLKGVLLYEKQYSCFDITEKNKENLRRILNPDRKDEEWIKSRIIAEGLLREEWPNYNLNQTHFYKKDKVKDLEEGRLKIDPRKLEPIDSKGFKHQFYREV